MNPQIYVNLVSEIDEELLAEDLAFRLPDADIVIGSAARLSDDDPDSFDSVEVLHGDELLWEEAVWILQKNILA